MNVKEYFKKVKKYSNYTNVKEYFKKVKKCLDDEEIFLLSILRTLDRGFFGWETAAVAISSILSMTWIKDFVS